MCSKLVTLGYEMTTLYLGGVQLTTGQKHPLSALL